MLMKNKTMFARDEFGKLIPREVELVLNAEDGSQDHLIGETINITPMVRGELNRLFSEIKEKNDTEVNDKIILEHCFEPKFTKEDIYALKGPEAVAIVDTILFESGLAPKKTKKAALEEKEDLFAKNLIKSEKVEKKVN